MEKPIPQVAVAMNIPQFCKWAGVSRSHFYRLVASGNLKALKSGKRVLILRSEAERWLSSLPSIDITESQAA